MSLPRFSLFARREFAVPPAAAPVGETATRQTVLGQRGFINWLPNPDPVLKTKGLDISAYRELQSEPALAGGIASRRAALLAMDWGFNRGKSKSRTSKLVEEHFKNTIDMHGALSEFFEGAMYGYHVSEVVSNHFGNVWLPERITGKPQEWFHFDEQNRLRLKTRNALSGELVEDRRFVLARKEASFANPYGIGDLSRCFWRVIFIRNGYHFWVQFSERYGMPWTVGKLPRGLDSKEYDKLQDMLETMVNDAIAVVPNDADIDLKTVNQTGSVDAYQKLVRECKGDISTIMRGHEGATNSTAGKLGGDDTANRVMDEIRDGDARMVCATMNQIIRWIYQVNWPNEKDIPVFEMWPKTNVDKNLADRDGVLATQIGVKFTKDYIAEEYGIAPEHFEIAEPAKEDVEPVAKPGKGAKPGAAFARVKKLEPPDDPVEAAVASIPATELQEYMEELLKPALDLLMKGGSEEAMRKRLVEAYPLMDDDAIETLLTKCIFIADIVAEAEAAANPDKA